jgi:hypothetical protein
MVFGWFKSETRERRRKIKLDRKHLEARSRRFLKSYLNADETRKPQFYRAVEEASLKSKKTRDAIMEKLMANLESKPDHLVAGAKKKSTKGTGKKLPGLQKASRLIEIGD